MPDLGPPVTQQIAASLARFFRGGDGPSHSVLSTVFMEFDFSESDPGIQSNKQTRVRQVLNSATDRPTEAQGLVEALLSEMRVARCFSLDETDYSRESILVVQRAFADAGWELSDDGELLFAIGASIVAVNGRPAIETQLDRLRRATDDPELLIGTAKEMLESTAKYVLEETDGEYQGAASFDELWGLARRAIGVHPEQIEAGIPGGAQVREIMQGVWNIARQVNLLRGDEGTGHGRTLPSTVTRETALLVVREACTITEFMLGSLDRYLRT